MVVETRSDFLSLLSSQPVVLVPIWTDAVSHPAANTLSLLGVVTADGEACAVPFDHSEGLPVPREWLAELTSSYYVADQKALGPLLPHATLADLGAVEWLESGSVTIPELPAVIKGFQTRFQRQKAINRAIPVVKWLEWVREWAKTRPSCLVEPSETVSKVGIGGWYSNTALPTLGAIEQAGLHVDPTLFQQHFGPKSSRILHGEFVFSRYNSWTATGRPACTFGGINFAALNKSDGSRNAFTSRFPNGMMVLLDYEGYHPRLIASLIGYALPTSSVHDYFGRLYFDTDTLTPKQYADGKTRTMYALYSDTEQQVEFFRQANSYKQNLFDTIKRDGYILSPITQRPIRLDRIEDPSPGKVMNYLIQWYETERNLTTLKPILALYGTVQSKIILYNYDSILIDFCLDDGKDVLVQTKRLLEVGGFPTRAYYGKNFGEMSVV